MQQAYVNINNIPTHIITWGSWIEESLDEVSEIAICITGNPGLPGFYTPFVEKLHKELEMKIPVWVIGHAGHDDPPASSIREVPDLKGNEELFDLKAQVNHKMEFIKKYVPPHVKIHLIGHSIGAWMIIQLLEKKLITEQIKKCYLLFPTIERMMESPNGWIFTKIALPLYSVFGFLFALSNRLPKFITLLIIHLYFLIFSIPNIFIETALKYSKASVSQKVVFMAEDEMSRVRGLQRDVIENNCHLLKLYYGTTDGWVPIKYYEQLKENFPNIDAELDTKKIDHAFVLRHYKEMAVIVGNMIASNSDILKKKE